MGRILPKCMSGRIESYVSAQGVYFPCCFIGNEPMSSQLKSFLGDELWSQLNTVKHDISEIENSAAMKRLADSWDDGSFEPCVFFCDKPMDDGNPSKRTRRDTDLTISLKTWEIE